MPSIARTTSADPTEAHFADHGIGKALRALRGQGGRAPQGSIVRTVWDVSSTHDSTVVPRPRIILPEKYLLSVGDTANAKKARGRGFATAHPRAHVKPRSARAWWREMRVIYYRSPALTADPQRAPECSRQTTSVAIDVDDDMIGVGKSNKDRRLTIENTNVGPVTHDTLF
jgi:hypothetical protein